MNNMMIWLYYPRQEVETMKNLGDLNNWTKNDLARVVCQALFNADKPLPAHHFQVKRMTARRKAELMRRCEQAIEIISKRKR